MSAHHLWMCRRTSLGFSKCISHSVVGNCTINRHKVLLLMNPTQEGDTHIASLESRGYFGSLSQGQLGSALWMPRGFAENLFSSVTELSRFFLKQTRAAWWKSPGSALLGRLFTRSWRVFVFWLIDWFIPSTYPEEHEYRFFYPPKNLNEAFCFFPRRRTWVWTCRTTAASSTGFPASTRAPRAWSSPRPPRSAPLASRWWKKWR